MTQSKSIRSWWAAASKTVTGDLAATALVFVGLFATAAAVVVFVLAAVHGIEFAFAPNMGR